MALEKITTVTGTGVHVPGADIDTDRIIPARFMKCVTFDGLGEYAFYDARFDQEGRQTSHPLNDPRFQGASVLVAGINFGCGSSREHAPQALYRFGFRAVVAQSYAEIFFGNCTTLGIPCVTASAETIETIRAAIESDPKMPVTIDVEKKEIRFGGQVAPVGIHDTAREALLAGKWDPIGDLLEGDTEIASTAGALAYLSFDPKN
jgi:3-isopropylmalate/(R)-2-methylmalate dehydratase small subunit